MRDRETDSCPIIERRDQLDRRAPNLLKEYVAPIIASVASAVFTGYLTLQVALATIETKLVYFESDIAQIKGVLDRITENQVELSKRGVWMSQTERRLTDIEDYVHQRVPTQKDLNHIEQRVSKMERVRSK